MAPEAAHQGVTVQRLAIFAADVYCGWWWAMQLWAGGQCAPTFCGCLLDAVALKFYSKKNDPCPRLPLPTEPLQNQFRHAAALRLPVRLILSVPRCVIIIGEFSDWSVGIHNVLSLLT